MVCLVSSLNSSVDWQVPRNSFYFFGVSYSESCSRFCFGFFFFLSHFFFLINVFVMVWSLCCFTLSGASAKPAVVLQRTSWHTHRTTNIEKKRKENGSNIMIRTTVQFPVIGLTSHRCVIDICLAAVLEGLSNEEMSHMSSVLPSLPVSPSRSLRTSINVREPSLVWSPQKPCFWLSLLWARYRRIIRGKEM